MRHPTLTCLACAALASAGALHAQTIRGKVLDQVSNTPIGDVLVVLLESDTVLRGYTRTAASGEFELSAPAPGRYRLSTRMLGYSPLTIGLPALRAEIYRLPESALRMVPLPAQLDPLTVEAERAAAHLEQVGFRQRRDDGGGSFVTRAEFTEWQPGRVTDVLVHLNRLRVRANPNYGRRGDFRRMLVLSRSRCAPSVFVDGVYVDTANELDVDTFFALGDIEAIEAYGGMADTPPQFQRRGLQCGAIVLWTRQQ